MNSFVVRRISSMLAALFAISIINFILIQLPPGDFYTSLEAELTLSGDASPQQLRETLDNLRERYGFDRPIYVQYFFWLRRFLQGDFGTSLLYNQPVSTLIGERLFLTFVVSFTSLLFTWVIGILIGVFTAVHKNTLADHFFTFVGFIGLSVPNFLLALVLLYISVVHLGSRSIGGLFSPKYVRAPWSLSKAIDLAKHIWIPVIVLGTAGTAGTIRIMRGNLLDVLNDESVTVARAKGLRERIVIAKYAVRLAINPLVSSFGMAFPLLLSGETIVSIVLSLPTTGPLLFEALRRQDMYLAGTLLFFLSFMLLVGNLVADILLAWLDPRIRFN